MHAERCCLVQPAQRLRFDSAPIKFEMDAAPAAAAQHDYAAMYEAPRTNHGASAQVWVGVGVDISVHACQTAY